MEYTIETIEETCISGIKTRTDNSEGIALIPRTWERFFTDNIPGQIEDQVNGPGYYAVYTEYEKDENGPYTFVIGSPTQVPVRSDGISAVAIPAGKYAVFTAAQKEKVADVWQHIWQSRLQRTYQADFEYYDVTTQEVKIFLGVK